MSISCIYIIHQWKSAKEAASALGLKAADTIYRAIKQNGKAAGYKWGRSS